MTGRIRRPGTRWRLLAHDVTRDGNGVLGYGTARNIQNFSDSDVVRPVAYNDDEYAAYRQKVLNRRRDAVTLGDAAYHQLPGAEFDELVVGQWLHVEQMDSTIWWLDVGGVTLHVKADRDGRPVRVVVHGPGDYGDRRPGCAYELYWTGDD